LAGDVVDRTKLAQRKSSQRVIPVVVSPL
jgi:hypothetical protein